ncbi:hypothetical protein [Actinomycetospora soli]|uniref:hypothetical protein n=1 Tax=Actinomycetospora soli TaxID=2893887 RepID=UPI001E65A3B1|nr:hypothetical protein [Actinomycetospora soli]MCD2191084.1 hypothetical protein [Actinomycetospora soli]
MERADDDEEIDGPEDQPCSADGCVAAGESAAVVRAVALLVEGAGPVQDMRAEVAASLRSMAATLEDTHPQGRMLAADPEVHAWASRLHWLLGSPATAGRDDTDVG